MEVYFGLFENKEDIAYNFQIHINELDDCEIIYAAYDCEYYEGDALVIFIQNGEIYEVNGGHCSCYGLEDQWVPEKSNIKALLDRPNVSIDAKNNIKERFKLIMPFI